MNIRIIGIDTNLYYTCCNYFGILNAITIKSKNVPFVIYAKIAQNIIKNIKKTSAFSKTFLKFLYCSKNGLF